MTKIKSLSVLSKVLARLRSKGKRIVFTNGCFDILHLGHIRYLKRAKKLGDILVIGLNSDRSVRLIKGAARPINRQSARAEILSALYFVDYVTIFNERTPKEVINKVRPDVLIKGGDWKAEDIVGASFVKSYGGGVVSLPFIKGYSTTLLIKKLRNE